MHTLISHTWLSIAIDSIDTCSPRDSLGTSQSSRTRRLPLIHLPVRIMLHILLGKVMLGHLQEPFWPDLHHLAHEVLASLYQFEEAQERRLRNVLIQTAGWMDMDRSVLFDSPVRLAAFLDARSVHKVAGKNRTLDP